MAAVLLVAGLAAVVLAMGGRSGPPEPPGWAATPRPFDHDGPVLGRSTPTQVTIPSIDVQAPLAALAPEADGTVGTPPADRPRLAGWHATGPAPGEQGAAVVLGHVDGRQGRAVFWDLGRLRPGDTVEVGRQDGRTAVFEIEAVEQVPKTGFPTQRVYGSIDHAGLRLITCGGGFDKKARSYRDNIIVYAHQVTTRHS